MSDPAEQPARPGGNRPRPIPSPWIECAACGWRHFPAMDHGSWRVTAAVCSSCGAPLEKPPEKDEA